jgi:hypothetical protein
MQSRTLSSSHRAILSDLAAIIAQCQVARASRAEAGLADNGLANDVVTGTSLPPFRRFGVVLDAARLVALTELAGSSDRPLSGERFTQHERPDRLICA